MAITVFGDIALSASCHLEVIVLRSNLELRSQWYGGGPLRGTAVFYDGGSLWGGTLESGWVHAVGLGVRAVMPQASSYPYRVDLGFLLTVLASWSC